VGAAPDGVIRNELTLLSPAFTTNSSLPSGVIFRCVSVPFAARVNTITELPDGSLVVV
jgi:hypothetical protein